MDRARLEQLLGVPAAEVTGLGTSHAWSLWRVVLADGREVFVKAADERSGVFAAEAAGLRWLADGPVPEVVAADDRLLVLPWLPSEPPSPGVAERFGRELAALHTVGAPSFGASWPGFIARLPLDNTPADRWPHWYAERRIAPYLRLAAPYLDPAETRLVERVMAEIETLAGPAEPPARIHGDLWSGNVLWSAGRAWLVDPAAHGGHRETDLAMLNLFGAPHMTRILASYQEASPLSPGWRARIPLHQLHPLLVHVALFGSSYRGAVVEAARAALRASG
ncbi:Fructosamine-3-kinase [Thermomonospora echinospora]|uniref:Fructosamine-3-kinase n=1 Tax=Thermomonospora echinospora TaxID=1992 RepID=A0A1H5YSR1_9ACTN|nr:fructosamine kinase family protein [Thermomonospora echinospora]SEG27223.1 Fructosamine-3-kinase [Thermomonospora echinospora]